jgi:hypothetical protein
MASFPGCASMGEESLRLVQIMKGSRQSTIPSHGKTTCLENVVPTQLSNFILCHSISQLQVS